MGAVVVSKGAGGALARAQREARGQGATADRAGPLPHLRNVEVNVSALLKRYKGPKVAPHEHLPGAVGPLHAERPANARGYFILIHAVAAPGSKGRGKRAGNARGVVRGKVAAAGGAPGRWRRRWRLQSQRAAARHPAPKAAAPRRSAAAAPRRSPHPTPRLQSRGGFVLTSLQCLPPPLPAPPCAATCCSGAPLPCQWWSASACS